MSAEVREPSAKYVLRSGRRQSDVGMLPDDWYSVKVGDVCDCIVPGRNKPTLFNGKIPWITTPDLENSAAVATSRLGLCISPEEAKSIGSKVVPIGAILMSCAGELGIVAMTKNEVVVNQQLHVFIPSERIEASFLLNALAYRKPQIESYGTKTAVPYLNKNACNSIRVPLPPLAEQRAIAKALSDVDALIAGLEKLIAKKRDLKQAAMQQLLTGQTRLPGFSGEWKYRSLGELCSLKSGASITSSGISDQGAYRCFGGNGLRGYTSTFTHNGSYALIGRQGALCGNVVGVQGKFFASEHALVVTPRIGVAIEWLTFVLGRMNLNQYSESSAQPGLSAFKLLILEVLTPPSEAEQAAIAEALASFDAELSALESRLAKNRELKQGMMQELLTGKTRLV